MIKKYLLYILIAFLINSCKEKKGLYQEKLNKAENIMSSNIPLEEKYNSLREFYYDLPENLQLKYGQEFFDSSSLKTELAVVNKNIMVRVSGIIYPNFNNKVFTDGRVEISSDLSFPNKNFSSIYLFEDIDFSTNYIDINLFQPLDNTLNFGLGKANEEVTIDSSFLSHSTESLDGKIVLKVQNQIGDSYDAVVAIFDLTDKWNNLANNPVEKVKFLSRDSQTLNNLNLENKNSTDFIKSDEVQEKTSSIDESSNQYVLKAEQMFSNYLPTLLKSKGGAVIDMQKTYLGDFTNDGIDDVIIWFGYTTGGNIIDGYECAFYEVKNNAVKVVAGFEPDYTFSINRISKGVVYAEKISYGENDPRCCPSIIEPIKLTYRNNKIYTME